MSKPWHPDEDIARARSGGGERLRSLDEFVRPDFLGGTSSSLRAKFRRLRKHRIPDGAKAGLVLLAAACIGAAIGLYEVAGPRDVFERDPAVNWIAVDEVATR